MKEGKIDINGPMNENILGAEAPDARRLPKNWQVSNLEQVVDILDNKRIPVNAKEREKRTGSIPYYGATGQVGWIDDYLFDEELVLLGEDGAPFMEPNKPKAYIIRGKSWVNNHAHVLRALDGIPSAYIKYCLDTFDYREFVTGTTRLKLNQTAMRRIPVPLAPPGERERIVAEIEKQFSRLDEAVTGLKRAKTNLKRYKAAVLKAAVEGKLTEQWRKEHPDVEPASKLLEDILTERRKKWEEGELAKMKAKGKATREEKEKRGYKNPVQPGSSDLGRLPNGWIWATADQCTSLITDGEHITPKRSTEGVLLLSARNVHDGVLNLDEVDYIPERVYEILTKRFVAVPGDVLLSCSGSVGRSCIVPENVRFGLVRSVAILKPLFKMGAYLSLTIRSPRVQVQINEKKTQTAQSNIFQGKIRTLLFPIPPMNEQELIVQEVERRFSVTRKMESELERNLRRADRLRQSILKKAFSGRLVLQRKSQ